jgi:hypothetical protein
MKNTHDSWVWDYKNATDLDDLAYLLYIREDNKFCENQKSWIYYMQSSFIGSVGHEKYYEQATIILRSLKINKIQNETEI